MLKRWKDFIFQDAESKNEIKKYVIIVRVCALLTAIYQVGMAGWALALGFIQPAAFFLAEVVVFSLIAQITYKGHSELMGTAYQIMLLVHMLGVSCFFGEETKIMSFIYLEIVLLYSRSFLKAKTKAAIVGGILILRWIVFIQDSYIEPMYSLTQRTYMNLTLINITIVVVLLSIAIYYASKDFLQMEQRIIMYNRNLEHMAVHDGLTGLYNRRKITMILQESLEYYKECNMNSLSVALGDIDLFKKINDVYGHDCGDKILRELSTIMDQVMSRRGAVGRWGGEEFLFVFVNHNGDEAYIALNELVNEIQNHEFRYGGETVGVTMTFGISECGFNITQEEMVKEADEKLYTGKKNGRNCIVF